MLPRRRRSTLPATLREHSRSLARAAAGIVVAIGALSTLLSEHAATDAVGHTVADGDAVLVKASHGLRLDTLVKRLASTEPVTPGEKA